MSWSGVLFGMPWVSWWTTYRLEAWVRGREEGERGVKAGCMGGEVKGEERSMGRGIE